MPKSRCSPIDVSRDPGAWRAAAPALPGRQSRSSMESKTCSPENAPARCAPETACVLNRRAEADGARSSFATSAKTLHRGTGGLQFFQGRAKGCPTFPLRHIIGHFEQIANLPLLFAENRPDKQRNM